MLTGRGIRSRLSKQQNERFQGIMKRKKQAARINILFVLLIALSIVACENERTESYQPEILRIAVSPGQSEEALRLRYTGLGEYLSAQTGLPYKLIIPGDYADLVNQFAQQQVDLALFGGLTYLQARLRADAQPLVMLETDLNFKSYFLVAAEDKDLSWSDLQDKTLSFGSRLSTSGHLMPRHFLQQKGIKPETYFEEIRFSGAHDTTAKLVESGTVDLGAASADIIDRMLADGMLDSEKIHIFFETPGYADYVWSVHSNLDQALQQTLKDSFLGLSVNDPVHASILAELGAEKFVIGKNEYFAVLDDIAREVGLLNEEDLD